MYLSLGNCQAFGKGSVGRNDHKARGNAYRVQQPLNTNLLSISHVPGNMQGLHREMGSAEAILSHSPASEDLGVIHRLLL